MKIKKFKSVLAIFSIMMLATVATVNAKSWSTATFTNIPAWGGSKVDLSHGNKKTTYESKMSYNCKKMTASLGNSFQLINGNQDSRSYYYGLTTINMVVVAPSYKNDPGATYYGRIKSNGLEWGSNNDVTVSFSSDPM